MKTLKILIFMGTIIGILFCVISCSDNQNQVEENFSHYEFSGSPKDVFNDNYYIDSKNRLYIFEHMQEEKNKNKVLLTNIIKVCGTRFAIDKSGMIWEFIKNKKSKLIPHKIEGLKNVLGGITYYQTLNNEIISSVDIFLQENGEIYIKGQYYCLDKKYDILYQESGYDTNAYPIAWKFSELTKINYTGKAKDLLVTTKGDFAIVLDNNDLISIKFTDTKGEIEESTLVKGFKELMYLTNFEIAVTDNGYYGWGEVAYRNEYNQFNSYIFDEPTKLAGMEPVLTCSESLIGMKDGSLWYRKKNTTNPVGTPINNIKDIVHITDNYAITANGSIYAFSGESMIPEKIADTGFTFDFEKTNEKYDFDIKNEYWRYGGYSQ